MDVLLQEFLGSPSARFDEFMDVHDVLFNRLTRLESVVWRIEFVNLQRQHFVWHLEKVVHRRLRYLSILPSTKLFMARAATSYKSFSARALRLKKSCTSRLSSSGHLASINSSINH